MPKKPSFEEKQIDLQIQQNKNLMILIDKVIPAVENYFNEKLKRVEEPKFKLTLLLFSIILLVVVIGTGFLVFTDKLDSSNFTFLLGILIGGILALIGEVVLTAQQ